jgi:hypothetical protein
MWFCSSPRGCVLPRQGINGNPSSCEDGISCSKEKVMKKKSKPQLRALGIIAAGMAVLMVLGACGGPLDDDTYKAGSPQAEGGENLVEVQIPLPKNDPPQLKSSRSVSAEMLQYVYLDYYEVIFRNRDYVDQSTTPNEVPYYIGTAHAGEDYLTVKVPATKEGKKYNILLLGGRYENRLLLITAFVNALDSNGKTTHVSGGQGVPIVAGKSNRITLAMTKLNLTLHEEDPSNLPNALQGSEVFVRYGSQGSFPTSPILITRPDNIATVDLGSPHSNSGYKLELKIETVKFADLIRAVGGDTAFNSNNFATCGAVLYPSVRRPFNAQLGMGTVTASGDTFTCTYTFENLPTNFTNTDLYAGLRYNFQYYAFGESASGSSKWEIRNGVNNYVLDDGEIGGLIRVQVGDGSSEDTYIVIDIRF